MSRCLAERSIDHVVIERGEVANSWRTERWPGLRLLAWEDERSAPLPQVPTPESIVVAVGPEGGFSAAEVDEARAHGFTTFALGPRLLRAETAAIVAAALCQARWGDLGSLSSTDRLG